jgi:hypothetical protein
VQYNNRAQLKPYSRNYFDLIRKSKQGEAGEGHYIGASEHFGKVAYYRIIV